jgi:hypothetical protein
MLSAKGGQHFFGGELGISFADPLVGRLHANECRSLCSLIFLFTALAQPKFGNTIK